MDEEVACKPYTNRRRFSVFTNMIPEKWTTDNIASIWFKWNIFLYTAYFGPSLIMRLYKYWRNECEINEVLFTRQINCSMCASRRNTHCDNQYCFYYTLGKIKSLIDGAQHSLYICMNIFTSVELGAVVLHAHERGVSVKIGANYSTAFATGSQLAMLHASDSDKSKKKLQVQSPEGARKIPQTGVVMSGSLNWTFQGMDKNFENVMVTSDKNLIGAFHEEFFEIWNHADSVDYEK